MPTWHVLPPVTRTLAAFVFGVVVLNAQQAPPGKPGQVEGIVTNSVTGGPVKKATVQLQNGPSNYEATTDGAGHFHFDNVAPGSYLVTGNRDGFIPVQDRQPWSKPITVAEEQQVKDVAVKLMPLAVVSGRVLDEDDDPISGAVVQALQNVYGRNGKQLNAAGSTNTNDLGEFQMIDLQPGRYYFRVMATQRMRNFSIRTRRRGPETAYPDTYYPNASLVAQATATQVAPGAQLTNIDFHLRKAPAFHIRGKAVDENGQPVHDTIVQLLPGSETDFFGFHPVQLRQDGTFDARGIVSGTYHLIGNESSGRNEVAYARESINVGDGDVDGIIVAFHKPVEVSGTIQFDGPAPKEAGQIQIMLESVDSGQSYNYSSNSAQGTFSQKVTPGSYRMNVSRAPKTYVKSMRFGEQDASSGRIEVTNAGGTFNVMMGTDVGELQGLVQNENGEPAAGAIVIVAPASEFQDRMDLFLTTMTSEDGKFDYQDFAPGEYKVFAWAAGGDQDILQSVELRKAFDSKAASVSVEPSGHASVQLKLISAAEIEAEKNKLP